MTISNDAKKVFTNAYFDGAAMVPSKWRDAYAWRYDDVGSLKLNGVESISTVPQWDGGEDLPQVRVRDIGYKTVTYVQYGVQLRLRKLDVRHDPTLLPRVAQRLGRAVENTYGNVAAAVLAGAFTTTTVVPGTKTLGATDHPTALGTRSNKLTSALDLAAVFAAITLARNWEDYDGGDLDLAEGGWNLLHPTTAGLEQTAAQVLGSQYTSDQLQVNTAGSYGITAIPWAKLSDANDWHMTSKVVKPVCIWEASPPEDGTDVDPDSRGTKVSLDFALAAFAEVYPTGYIGSSVA